MDGNIYRRHAHFYYAVDILIGEVCHRDIVALQKRKAAVIILEIERVSHSFRKLVDKAENAFVSARVLAIHEKCLKFQPDIIVFVFFYFGVIFLSVALKQNIKLFVTYMKSVVENIVNRVSVHSDKLIARGNPRPVGIRAFSDRFYLYHTNPRRFLLQNNKMGRYVLAYLPYGSCTYASFFTISLPS